ncbi:MAG: histidine kinase, partial [Bacteroidota bacterium]
VRPPFWRTWWFLFLSGIVIAGILGLIYWSRVQIIKKEEGLKTAFNKQLAEVEMSALRAQMNPHFLFNCMNSINLFILKNDTEAASDYLTKFSRLIRLILNNSKAKSIPLSKEIDALDLYVQMEQLRFTQQFDYVLDLAPDIGAEQVHIPPMILQPYVENAIWHGLMNKEGKGRLRLSIKLMDEHLYCEIEDNGIGREAALKQKERAAKTRASVGMKITKTRMDLTHQLYQIQGGVEIVDLYDKDSKPRGTLVKLKIPKLIPESYESINR